MKTTKRILVLLCLMVVTMGAWADPTMTLTVKEGNTVIVNAVVMTSRSVNHWSFSYVIPEAQDNKLLNFQSTYNDGEDVNSQVSYLQVSGGTTVTFYDKYADSKALVFCDAMEIGFADVKWRRLGILKPSIGNESSSSLLNIYSSNNMNYHLLSGVRQTPTTYYIAGCKSGGSDRKISSCALKWGDNTSYANAMSLTIPQGIYRATITYAECLIELVPVTTFPLTIGKDEAATLCLPYEVTLPAALTAYTLTSNGTTTLTGAKDDDNVIPANTPVLVTGPANDYNITLPEEAASYITESMDNSVFLKDAEPDDGNVLHGVMAPHYVRTTGVNYVLQNNNGNLGFYQVDNDTYLINPFRAFVNLASEPAGARGLSIVFDDGETTGIADVRGQKEDVRGDIFNLSGQRVGKDYKGVVIKNGRKMIQK